MDAGGKPRRGAEHGSRAAAFRQALAALLLGVSIGAPGALALGDAPREPARVQAGADAPSQAGIAAADLPREARETIARIRRGGPHPYDRDGAEFRNFEKRLPLRPRGYYREYTVRTPGVKHRGARRIVAGRGGELYYTDDHYLTFRRVKEP